MKERTAIILSLAMLLDKVDVDSFIGQVVRQAMVENPQFKVTSELRGHAFRLTENYNKDELQAEEFRQQFLDLLGIKTMPANEFWLAWDEMITVGQIKEKIEMLKRFAQEQNALFYIETDSNWRHLDKIESACKAQDINCYTAGDRMRLDTFRLYSSCQLGKIKNDLLAVIFADIQSKTFKADTVILILPKPQNSNDENLQQAIREKNSKLEALCAGNNVKIGWRDKANTLEETLEQVFAPEVQATNENRITFG